MIIEKEKKELKQAKYIGLAQSVSLPSELIKFHEIFQPAS